MASEAAQTPEELVQEIVGAVERFESHAEQRDDVTILAVGYNGVQPS